MKILQINASYKPAYIYGGPTMSVSKLSEAMVKAGCRVEVYTTTANGTQELNVSVNTPLLVDGVTVTYFKRLTKDHSHFSPALLQAVWQNAKNFDVIHINAWWNTISVLACRLALLRGVPVIISPRGMLSNYSFNNRNSFFKSAIHQLSGKSMLKQCGIHVTSAHEEMAIRNIITPKFIANLPNFIEPGKPVSVEKDFEGTLKLLFLSRIEEKKGLDILITALAELTTPYHLTIAGSGDEDYINQLKQLIQQHNIQDSITWAGFQKENKFDMLQQHHLLILPSHDENFGNVVIESLSVGTAVLISNKVGLAHYVSQNKLGWVCTTNAADITEHITTIAQQRGTLKTISRQAPAIIYHDFDENMLAKKYLEMYNQYISYSSKKRAL